VSALRDLGLLLGELVEHDELVEDCAHERAFEGFVLVMGFPVVNGVGSTRKPAVFR
jgi:hypothetical protein